MDRGAWRATDHGIPKSRTRLSTQSTHYFPSPLSPSSATLNNIKNNNNRETNKKTTKPVQVNTDGICNLVSRYLYANFP